MIFFLYNVMGIVISHEIDILRNSLQEILGVLIGDFSLSFWVSV